MCAADFVAATWRKSSRSNGGGGSCVEVARVTDAAGIRDSKLGQLGPVVTLKPKFWSEFLTHLKSAQ